MKNRTYRFSDKLFIWKSIARNLETEKIGGPPIDNSNISSFDSCVIRHWLFGCVPLQAGFAACALKTVRLSSLGCVELYGIDKHADRQNALLPFRFYP